MNRAEFMARLRELLSDITEAEREEALNYYEDYFDDAGVENEASVIGSLGSPEKVAATIKDGLNDSEGMNGEFSEKGYTNTTYDNRDEVAERTLGKKNGLSGGMLVLVVILCIFALPILAPIVVGLISAVFGILCAIVAVVFAVMVTGVSIVVSGIALLAAGITTLIEAPVVGILLVGAGLILAGIGILIAILGAWIIAKVVPSVVRGIVNLCRKPFERKRG